MNTAGLVESILSEVSMQILPPAGNTAEHLIVRCDKLDHKQAGGQFRREFYDLRQGNTFGDEQMMNNAKHQHEIKFLARSIEERRTFPIAPSHACGRTSHIHYEWKNVELLTRRPAPQFANDDWVRIDCDYFGAELRSQNSKHSRVAANVQNVLWFVRAKDVKDEIALDCLITGRVVAFFGIVDRKSTRLNSSHVALSRMPSSA